MQFTLDRHKWGYKTHITPTSKCLQESLVLKHIVNFDRFSYGLIFSEVDLRPIEMDLSSHTKDELSFKYLYQNVKTKQFI